MTSRVSRCCRSPGAPCGRSSIARREKPSIPGPASIARCAINRAAPSTAVSMPRAAAAPMTCRGRGEGRRIAGVVVGVDVLGELVDDAGTRSPIPRAYGATAVASMSSAAASAKPWTMPLMAVQDMSSGATSCVAVWQGSVPRCAAVSPRLVSAGLWASNRAWGPLYNTTAANPANRFGRRQDCAVEVVDVVLVSPRSHRARSLRRVGGEVANRAALQARRALSPSGPGQGRSRASDCARPRRAQCDVATRALRSAPAHTRAHASALDDSRLPRSQHPTRGAGTGPKH